MDHQRVVAIAYDRRGRVLAIGHNSYVKTHPIQSKYAMEAHRPGAVYLHAEIDALIKCGFSAHSMTINRFGRSGKSLASKPCPICLRAIADAGIRSLNYIAPGPDNVIYHRLESMSSRYARTT